jgi:hypothetical protein
MTTVTVPAGRARRLTPGELASAKAVATAAGLLGLLGFANSFRAVSAAAQASFGAMAPSVPLGIDLAIGVFSAMDIVLARLDMRPRWVRLIPWALTAATVYLNVEPEHTWFGRIAHAVFPALWVIAVSLAAHVVRVRAHLASGTAIDRIRASRWMLAPVPTARLWRRMVLWEIRSYPAALDRERARVLALTGLQDEYGLLAWRWRAPRRIRALYRLGEHDAISLPGDDDATAHAMPEGSAEGHVLSGRELEAVRRLAAELDEVPGGAENPAEDGAGEVDRDALVDELAAGILAAARTGDRWRADYDALMERTKRSRRWCEYLVADARGAVFGSGGQAPAEPAAGSGQNPQDAGPAAESRADGSASARTGDARAEDADGSRTDQAGPAAGADDRLVLAGANGRMT